MLTVSSVLSSLMSSFGSYICSSDCSSTATKVNIRTIPSCKGKLTIHIYPLTSAKSRLRLSPYAWQTATNIMNLVTGLIAAALYGNIGLKVVYNEVSNHD